MDKSVRREVGGTAVHIGNYDVWAQIQYLDSPTDYREFIPRQLLDHSSDEHRLECLSEVTEAPLSA